MWQYLPNGWPEEGLLQGWNAQGVLDAYLQLLPKLQCRISRNFPLPFDTPDQIPNDRDYLEQNIYLSYGYVLGMAAHAKDAISILDWGGAVGQYFLITQVLMPDLDLDYHIKDVSILCEGGSRVLAPVHFHSEEKTCLGRNYDLVLASGSLQYSQDWREVLSKLARVASSYLYVTRIPVVYQSESFVAAQQAYETVHAGWVLNKFEFLETARRLGLRLLREFAIDLPFQPTGAPEMCHQEGFLFLKPNPIF